MGAEVYLPKCCVCCGCRGIPAEMLCLLWVQRYPCLNVVFAVGAVVSLPKFCVCCGCRGIRNVVFAVGALLFAGSRG